MTWPQVLDYFDALPSASPRRPRSTPWGYFNRNLVAQYLYERSVVDGANVGFVVFRIRTEIGVRGGTVKASYDLPIRDSGALSPEGSPMHSPVSAIPF